MRFVYDQKVDGVAKLPVFSSQLPMSGAGGCCGRWRMEKAGNRDQGSGIRDQGEATRWGGFAGEDVGSAALMLYFRGIRLALDGLLDLKSGGFPGADSGGVAALLCAGRGETGREVTGQL
jgi:hypothetical protein